MAVRQQYAARGVPVFRRLLNYLVSFNLMVLGYLVAKYAHTNLIGENPAQYPPLVMTSASLVVFALGCSFTFEQALLRSGVPIWHIEHNTTVPMFRSNRDTVPAGPFSGAMVVSMRAIPEARVDEVIEISRRFPLAHGAPVYWGDPAGLGIADINRPDWGDPAPIEPGQVPVFWACGVTPQVAIEAAGLPLCITHKPGHMLITDVAEDVSQ